MSMIRQRPGLLYLIRGSKQLVPEGLFFSAPRRTPAAKTMRQDELGASSYTVRDSWNNALIY